MKFTHLLAAALITALILSCLAAPAAAFSGGSGTEADPYIVSSAEDFIAITATSTYTYYKQVNDITFSGLTNPYMTLHGNYNGQGFKLDFTDTITGSTSFITASTNADIENVHFTNLNGDVVNGLIVLNMLNTGSISNCVLSNINIRGSAMSGFLSSYNINNVIIYESSIQMYGSVSGSTRYIGGIGSTSSDWRQNPSYTNSVSISTTLSTSNSHILTRIGTGTITNCYASTTSTINGAIPTTNIGANAYNGATITATEYNSESWWKTTMSMWDWENIWQWNSETNLPELRNANNQGVPPTISAISATPATGGQTTEYTLSVTATTEAAGSIASYQWYYSTNGGTTWQPISEANSASYVWQPGQSISGDVLLKCLVTGADGGEIDSYEAGYTNIKITIITPPAISSISVSRPLQKVNSPTTLTAIFADTQTASYQWYYSTNGGTTWQAISGATQTTAQYTPTTTGTHSVKIIATNQYSESSELSTTIIVLPTYTPTPITQTTFDASIDSSAKYQGVQQFTLSAELSALNYYTPNLAHLAHDNALYYLDSAEQEVIPVSNTTGGTISAAYLGQYTGVITDTAGNTAFYSYQSNDWQYIEQNNAQIIASTSSYAATVSGGTISIYNLNGNLVASTATTAANLAGNDQTNVFVSYSGATITYYWYQDNEIKTASKTLPHTITELHQISTTSNWLISTTANTYTVSISDIGSYELLSTTDTDTPLIHTQATNINVLIGVAEPNEIFIVGADGETDGTYVTGSTLNDASIAKATGLFAITGGEDRQVYILAKSTSSTWQLLQTISFGAAIDHSQISTTGTYIAVSTGLKLYLLEAVDISANTYLLQGVIIGSSGSVWANKPFTINGDNLRTDANGRFVYSVQPSTLYTIVTDTTTTEYTATNAALQQIAIKLKPNPFAQSVSYSTDYNADTRNFEMIYTDTRDLTSSVTWVIRETGNQTIVSTQTVQAGQTAYWEVPLDKSFTSYQISMIADRQGTNVENVWIITPDGKSPINIPGLDETGRTIIFGAVLMIFGGLFGVMHSTKGALLTVALAGVMTYLGLLNIPWVIIMVAGTIAVAAILGKGSGGS